MSLSLANIPTPSPFPPLAVVSPLSPPRFICGRALDTALSDSSATRITVVATWRRRACWYKCRRESQSRHTCKLICTTMEGRAGSSGVWRLVNGEGNCDRFRRPTIPPQMSPAPMGKKLKPKPRPAAYASGEEWFPVRPNRHTPPNRCVMFGCLFSNIFLYRPS